MLAEAPVEIRAFAQGAEMHPVFDFKRPFRALFLYPKTKDEVVIMAKLTDKQKKKIIAEHIEGATIRALAKKYKVSTTTVQRVLKSDADFTQKVTEKKEDNAKQVLLHMEEKKNQVCTIIDKILSQMEDDAKIAATPLNQLATTMGILIDKYTANEIARGNASIENNLAEAIEKAAKAVGDGKK